MDSKAEELKMILIIDLIKLSNDKDFRCKKNGIIVFEDTDSLSNLKLFVKTLRMKEKNIEIVVDDHLGKTI